EAARLRDELEMERLIERAKGLLMAEHDLTAEAAAARLTALAARTGKTPRETASAIVLAHNASSRD
ncbi:MAG: ANTAR domain-containing protein, partial [Chloroflexi bacterium]|nr:ANTAR domain-containing protein [Chloroflexota bacterium]